MGVTEGSATSIPPLLMKNLMTPMFLYADKSLLSLAQKHKVLDRLRYLLLTCFFFLLRLLPSLNPDNDSLHDRHCIALAYPVKLSKKNDAQAPATCGGGGGGDSGIARALTQILSIANEIPVSSRKYDVVRSLADRLIEDNNREGFHALREVNRTVLSAAFDRSLSQLEAAVSEKLASEVESGGDSGVSGRLGRVVKAVRSFGVGRGVTRERVNRSAAGYGSAEKLAAELLWLAQRLVRCGFQEEAVRSWAAASNLAWLAVSAEPRLQGSLVKLSGLVFSSILFNSWIYSIIFMLDYAVAKPQEKKKKKNQKITMTSQDSTN